MLYPSSLIPSTEIVYCRQATKFAWVSVRVVFPFDQARVNVTSGGARFTTTVPVFIALLNAIRTSWVCATFVAPSAGTVWMMYGFAHTATNLNGSTTVESIGFGIRGFPVRSVALTVTVYTPHPVNTPVWVIVNTVSPLDHVSVCPVTVGEIVNERLLLIIASLNVTTTEAPKATPGCTFLGDVDTMYGLSQNERKVHGFGTGPGTRARFALSVALIWTEYGVHWEKPWVWLRVSVASPFDHDGESATLFGVRDTTRDEGFIPSLKFTKIDWSHGTPPWLYAGFVFVIHGLILSVTNVNGFGAPAPPPGHVADSGKPSRSFALIWRR